MIYLLYICKKWWKYIRGDFFFGGEGALSDDYVLSNLYLNFIYLIHVLTNMMWYFHP